MKTKEITIQFLYFGKLRLCKKQGYLTLTEKINGLAWVKRGYKEKLLAKKLEDTYNISDVKITHFIETEYKWWEFWK